MYNKAVNAYPSAIQFILNWYKTQEMCDKVVSKDPFMLKYCLDKYNSHEISDKAVGCFSTNIKICFWLVCYKEDYLKTWWWFNLW